MSVRAAAIAMFSLCVWSETLPIRSYTIADGLPSDQVDGVVPDSRGFVWFYTPEGLARFDGFRITRFGPDQGLPSRVVQTFLETRTGEYLIGTPRGLCKFKPGTGKNQFATFLPGTKPEENSITALYESQSGKLWAGTWDGLFEIANGAQPGFRRQKLPDPPANWKGVVVSDILEDKCGKIWLASIFGIYVVNRANDTVQWLARRGSIQSEVVNALLRTRDGRLLAGGRVGLVLLDDGCDAGHAPAIQRIYPEEAGQDVRALAEGPDGTIWIASGVGIFRRPPGGGASQLLNRSQGLSDRSVFSLAVDKTGNLWAGTEGAGAMKIQADGFRTFHEQDGLRSDRVFSVLGDRAGRVVAVTGTADQTRWSLNVLDGGKFRSLDAPKIFADHRTWGSHRILIQSKKGEWWAATNQGLCRYQQGTAEELATQAPLACYFPNRDVFQVFEDSKGGIWASAQSPEGDRLMRWDPEKNAVLTLEDFPRHPTLVKSFAEDRDGNIWFGVWGPGGLYRYDGRTFAKFTAADGLPQGTIFALLIDASGRLWIGAEGGLGLVENPGAKSFSAKRYRQAEGLSSEVVRVLIDDTQGNIYAGTAAGVDRLDPKTGSIRHFSAADGLARGQLHSAFRDSTGNLWFATAQGLSRLTPALARRPASPEVVVTAVEAGGMPVPVSPRGNTMTSNLELEPSRNRLQIEFVAFTGEPEANLRYAYKLDVTDPDWSPLRRDHLVNFAALGAGKYRFLVKAVNSDGFESARPAEVDFTVLPPFWKRWWFEGLALAALASIVYLFHRYRVAQAVSLERMRTTIATDLHDDIGAGLSQIAVLSEVARSGVSPHDRLPQESMQRVGALARELVDSMSDIVWSIRAEPDGLESLVRRMREFALDLLVSQGIEFDLRTPRPLEDVPLSLQARRHLLMMFKECIHNAARHSACTAVTAELAMAEGGIRLTVSDNGRGFRPVEEPAKSTAGNGIPGMRLRAASLGGSVAWRSEPGKGCTVEIRFPMRAGS